MINSTKRKIQNHEADAGGEREGGGKHKGVNRLKARTQQQRQKHTFFRKEVKSLLQKYLCTSHNIHRWLRRRFCGPQQRCAQKTGLIIPLHICLTTSKTLKKIVAIHNIRTTRVLVNLLCLPQLSSAAGPPLAAHEQLRKHEISREKGWRDLG